MVTITWTMNCILFGARIISLVREGKLEEVEKEIKNLSSEFNALTTSYLIKRLLEQ